MVWAQKCWELRAVYQHVNRIIAHYVYVTPTYTGCQWPVDDRKSFGAARMRQRTHAHARAQSLVKCRIDKNVAFAIIQSVGLTTLATDRTHERDGDRRRRGHYAVIHDRCRCPPPTHSSVGLPPHPQSEPTSLRTGHVCTADLHVWLANRLTSSCR